MNSVRAFYYIITARTFVNPYKYIDCNLAAVKIYNCSSKEAVIGKSPLDFSAPVQYDGTPSTEKTVFFINKAKVEGSTIFEWKHRRPDGEIWDAEVHLLSFQINRKPLLQFSLIDITQRKMAEKHVRESEARYRFISENTDDVIWILNLKTNKFTFVSPSVQKLRGYTPEEVMNQTMAEALTPDSLNALTPLLIKAISARKPGDSDMFKTLSVVDQPCKDGSVVSTEVATTWIMDKEGQPLEIIGVSRNITERKKLEEELQKMQKLQSLSILAGGIAHDFNNLLSGIYGYISLATYEVKDEKLSEYLSKAMTTMERARGLTLQLLTFAKGGAPIRKIGNLFPFVQETAQFTLSGSNIFTNFDIPDNLSPCNFDKNQIEQVIDNIVINAKQAMPDGGTITISAQNVSISLNDHLYLKNGDYVRISIKDQGIGIPKNILPHIFDPFFTTKATGNGLGLASCYSIIKRHNGAIEVESEPGEGSTFHIYLPSAIKEEISSDIMTNANHEGSGTFLVLDDQDFMRDTIGGMLKFMGYTVVCKDNGKDVVEYITAEFKSGRKLSGIILDLTIPGGMGGKETMEEIKKLHPKVTVFAMSGYAEDPIIADPVKYGFTASICKPFKKSELAELLNKYLETNKS
jgi:PAS domain S-box-containing protein